MELGTRDTLLTLGTSIALLAGAAMVLLGDATLTTVGIVLVTLSAIVFIVDAKDLIVRSDEGAKK